MPWENKDNQLSKTFTFKNFLQALDFTNKVGEIAEKLGHHPTIILSWGKVIVSTTTHDQDNQITEKDWELARAIDEI